MQKLLCLILSANLLFSSVTPALAQVQVGHGMVKGLQKAAGVSAGLSNTLYRRALMSTVGGSSLHNRILAGQTAGVAHHILTQPSAQKAALLRNEFLTLSLVPQTLTPAQRVEAVNWYQKQLQQTKSALKVAQTNLNTFVQTASAQEAQRVRQVLTDATAIGLVGGKEQAPLLADFYKQAQGTLFEDTALLIAARGFLRMQAYAELETLLSQHPNKAVLSGVATYAQTHRLPISLPQELLLTTPTEVSTQWASFLTKPFLPNYLQADASLQATEQWMALNVQPQAVARPAQTFASMGSLRKTVQQAQKAKGEPVLEETPQAKISAVDPQADIPTAVAPAQHVVYRTEQSRKPRSLRNAFSKHKKYDRVTFPVSLMNVEGEVADIPVTFSIGESLTTKGYDRIVFREDPRFENGYIIELHDHGKEPIKMEHFYMALYHDDIGALVEAALRSNVKFFLKLEHTADVNYETISKTVYSEKTGEALPLEISVQLDKPVWSREMQMGISHWMENKGLSGIYAPHVLTNAKLVLRDNGEIWMQPANATELVPLPEQYYVRLPKNQIRNLVKIMPQVAQNKIFNIVLSPTAKRVNMVARDASLTNVSLGKTMGSIVNGSLGISESNAKSLMFSINYVLPGFASLLTPVLKKYGEKNLLSLSLGMSVASGLLATAGGFYGFVEQLTLGPVQKALFVSALLLMSGASILKQLVSNMLIRANRGEVVLSGGDKKSAAKTVAAQEQTEGATLIAKRFKEFFTKKSEVSLRDIALYNLGFVYKNIGTLAFLAAPFLINSGIKGITGVDLGIDYSASFPLYAGYTSYVMWKILRSKLRDAYTAKNLLQSQQMLTNMLKTGAQALAMSEVSSKTIDDVARSFKDSLDALAFAHIKMDPSKEKKLLYQDAKERVLTDLERNLVVEYHVSADKAHELVSKVAASINVQENVLGNMWKMLKAPGVAAVSTAMTLATVHEFVISSSFSGIMKSLVPNGELANFLIATSLYMPFIVGRLGGSWISRRISPDTMYLFCSSLSALGTGIMATAGTSVGQTIAGAAIASLGVGNFFTQMYDYIMTKYPKQNREISSILALTMGIGGLGAIPAGYFAGQAGFGIPLDLLYAGGMLGASFMLTPGMFMNSSLIKGLRSMFKQPWEKIKKWLGFDKGPQDPPLGTEQVVGAN